MTPPIYDESWFARQLSGTGPTRVQATGQARRLDGINNCTLAPWVPQLERRSTTNVNIYALPLVFDRTVNTLDYLGNLVERIYQTETSALDRFPKSDRDLPCSGGDGKFDIYIFPTLITKPDAFPRYPASARTCRRTCWSTGSTQAHWLALRRTVTPASAPAFSPMLWRVHSCAPFSWV